VSREHCRIWFDPADRLYKIADPGSANGTLVNGERLKGERVLRGGEVISVGSTVLRFEHDSPAWDFADYFPEVEVRLSGYRIRQPVVPPSPPATP
jgi:pSer/pThr/pTyr-binding forkhead associated (FHA) protein